MWFTDNEGIVVVVMVERWREKGRGRRSIIVLNGKEERRVGRGRCLVNWIIEVSIRVDWIIGEKGRGELCREVEVI